MTRLTPEAQAALDGASTISINDPPEAFPHLPALAERLGVKPNEGDGKVWLTMKDGTNYDLFALVNAVLDRMDAAARR